MGISQILQELGPENIVPGPLLGDILANQTPADLTDGLAMLLAEVLDPGSQSISGSQGEITSLTPQTIPEASARGSQVGSMIRKLPIQPDWNEVFANMKQRLPSPKMTEASLSELLSALDDQTIDVFLEYDWTLDFNITLFVNIRQLNPLNGSFDLLKTNYLKPIVTDAAAHNIKNTVLFFRNVTNLEIYCISMSSSINNLAYKKFLHQVFEEDIKAAPELIAMGCVLFSPPSPIVDDLFENMMVHLLDENSPYYSLVWRGVSNVSLFQRIATKIVKMKTATALNKTLIALMDERKLLPDFLDSFEYSEAFSVGLVLVKLGYVDVFQTYLSKPKEKPGFAEAVLKFFENQVALDRDQRTTSLRGIWMLWKMIPQLNSENLNNLRMLVLQAFPRLINFGFGHDEAILSNNAEVNTFPMQIESQMKGYYQRMYNHDIEIKDVITMLQRLRDSDAPPDQDLFACMIHSLLDEYKFFPEYPLNALAITSVLFGSMIHFELIREMALTVALSQILKSCQEPPEDNMFKFAVQALYAFRHRLKEWPAYCLSLSEIPGLRSQETVFGIIRDVLNSAQSQSAAPPPALQQAVPHPRAKSRFKSINPTSTIVNNVPQEQPTHTVSQKVMFVMNNLTEDNVLAKADELKSVLTPSVYAWFSTYIVEQRAQAESNNHHIYFGLVDRINDELLFEHIISVTVELVNNLLSDTDDLADSPEDRQHLRNLAGWLGLVTLSRNKPLKHRTVALKELLIEAYDQKKLALAIPFVCKTLEHAKNSEVFRLPNPWTLGILRVLAELYEIGELKLNLKFEIELLCKNLNVELKDIEKSTIIEKHDPVTLLQVGVAQMSLDMKQQALMDQASMTNQPLLNRQALPPQAMPPTAAAVPSGLLITEANFQSLAGVSLFVTNPTLRRLFATALAKSVREILPPAVERAVSIAVTTARTLVLKDFATEGDEVKFRDAAVNLVSRLAERLALATCRDPLKESISTNVQTMSGGQMLPLEELPQAVSDNIGLACDIIQRAARDKAIKDIDEVLITPITARRMHKEKRPDLPFLSTALSRYAVNLPEPLGLRPTGVTAQQLDVYTNFGQTVLSPMSLPPQPVQSEIPQAAPVGTPSAQPSSIATVVPQPQQQPSLGQIQQQAIQQMNPEATLMYILQSVEALVGMASESTVRSFQDIPTDSQIRVTLNQIFSVFLRNIHRDLLLHKMTGILLNGLLSATHSDLAVECFILLVAKVSDFSQSFRKDVAFVIENSPDARKFDVRILRPIFALKLVSPVSFDSTLASYVSESTASFVVGFIRESLLSESYVAFLSDYASTLNKLKEFKDTNEDVKSLLTSVELWDFGLLKGLGVEKGSDIPESGKLTYIFLEWTRLLQNHTKPEEFEIAFIVQLMNVGILDSFDRLTLFLRSAVETAVDYFKSSDPASDGFQAADSLSKLIVKLTTLQNGKSRERTLKTAFSIVSLVFAEDHQTSAENFNERPYFRIFSSLLCEWSSCEDLKSDVGLTRDFYIKLSEFLNIYQPLSYPGFAFAWITLISHRFFLPTVVEFQDNVIEAKFVLLLLDLLRFQSHYVKNKQIPEVFTVIYKGTLRLFLLLLHDYPEILVKYHYQLCCEMPPSFIQLRNIVLSAFPRGLSMPDPFTYGLKVDRLPAISVEPNVGFNPGTDIKQVKKVIDGYLRIPSNVALKTIMNAIKKEETAEAGIGYDKSHFDVKMINAIVLYVGMHAVADKPANGPVANPKSTHFGLLSALMREGGVELQYHVMSAVANQLRYPNSHTHWFSYLTLYFFSSPSLWNDKKSQVQHVITRVLLERLICNRPHPWGLLITFVELLKNNNLSFFESEFIKEDPEMEKLFASFVLHFKNTNTLAATSTNGSETPASA